MKLKTGVPCPIAALANKDTCLFDKCGWYLPGSELPCIITAQTSAIMGLIELVETLTDSIREREKSLDAVDETLKELNRTLEGKTDE